MADSNQNLDGDVLRVNALEAREIRLVDDSGKERASLSCSNGSEGESGYIAIQLYDDDQRPRIELQVDGQGCSIRLNTQEDAQGLMLSVSDGIGTGFGINDGTNQPKIRIGISHPSSGDPRGSHPEVTLHDNGVQRSWTIDS